MTGEVQGPRVAGGVRFRTGLTYEHFRNSVIAKMTPPSALAAIMGKILGTGR